MPILIALMGCVNLQSDAAIYSALDYLIDRPRALGMRVDPPLFAPGIPVTFEALLVAPHELQAATALWSTCGLSSETLTTVETLQCFSDDLDVSLLSEGLMPSNYAPDERPAADCQLEPDAPLKDCTHELPLIVESDFAMAEDGSAGDWVRASTQTLWYLTLWPAETPLPESARALPRALSYEGDPLPGAELSLSYVIQADLREARFQWYVDDGVLLDTGETATRDWERPSQPGEKGVTTTENRWVLPETPGVYRLFVLFDGQDWDESSPYASAPDQVWDSLEVEVL